MRVNVKTVRSGIFGNRSFLDYFGMFLTSRSAFQVATVGLIWLVNAVTHSALDIAIVGVANTVSTVVVTLPAGVWVDRVDRRILLLISNVASVACLALLTFLTVISIFEMAFVVAIVVLWAAAGELYRSTSYAVLPEIVREEELSNANGVTQFGYQIVSSVSTALGGPLIVIAGVALTFAYGAVGYGLAALFSGFLLYRFHGTRLRVITPEAKQTERNMLREIREGFLWLLTQPGLFGLSLLALVCNFLFGIPIYFLVIYVTVTLKAGALLYAGLSAIFVAGAAIGSLVAGRMSETLAYAGKVNILSWGGAGGAMLLVLGLFPQALIALLAALGIGLGLGFGTTVWLTSAQNLVPIEMRGRYFAIDGLLSFIGGPPSIAVGGILITLIGMSHVLEMSGVLLLVSALVFSFMKSLWILDGRPKELRS